MEDKIKLLIAIPTYNRREQLKNTLEALANQTDSDFRIVISDNASDYDVAELIGSFPDNFKKKIEYHRRTRNIGADANIIGLFESCSEGWIWTLSDDDSVESNAVEKIKYYINKNPQSGCIDFFMLDNLPLAVDESISLRDINEFSDFYLTNKQPNSLWHGELIFLSNKVFNIDLVGKYVEYAYKYIYTRISTVVIFSYMLADKIPYTIVNHPLVEVGKGSVASWGTFEVYLASRTLYDMKVPCSREEFHRLLEVLAFDIRDILYIYFNGNNRFPTSGNFLEQMYVGIYKKILRGKYRMAFGFCARMSKTELGYRIVRTLVLAAYKLLAAK